VPGLADIHYSHDGAGRLSTIEQAGRATHLGYNTEGFLASVTDPMGQTTGYRYDPTGRVTEMIQPDGSAVLFQYDLTGNLTVLTVPSGVHHGFGYNALDLNSSYDTPLSGSYRYDYDRDKRLRRTVLPSGRQILNTFEHGRLVRIDTEEGRVEFPYLCGDKVA